MLRLELLVVLGTVLLGYLGCGAGECTTAACENWKSLSSDYHEDGSAKAHRFCECPAMVEGVLKLTTDHIDAYGHAFQASSGCCDLSVRILEVVKENSSATAEALKAFCDAGCAS
jgi:hypothetical protein